MSNYYLGPDGNVYSEEELCHWKYIKREKVNGKWKYYYDKDSAKKNVGNAISNMWSKIRSVTKKRTEYAKKKMRKVVPSATKKIATIKSKVAGIVKRAKAKVHKYIAKVPVGDTFRYFYSDEAYRAYLNGKNATHNAADKLKDKKVGALIDDVTKNSAKGFVSNILSGGFGKAVYNLVLPAFTAIQVAAQTPDSFDDVKKLDKKQSNAEDQAVINPDYKPKKFDYSYNCSFCTAAYDLRKRGYDVEAMPISVLEGPVVDDILSWYKGSKAVSEDRVTEKLPQSKRYKASYRAKALNESLAEYGDGARGHLCMYWKMGGGHDIVWSVENGKVVYRDCQTNQTLDMTNTLQYVGNYSYVRVDNCEPTEEVLRTVRNRD